jgi:ABC-type lipoprotein export system ATPase subunit
MACSTSHYRQRDHQRAGCNHLNRNQRADLRKNAIGFVFQFFALIPT